MYLDTLAMALIGLWVKDGIDPHETNGHIDDCRLLRPSEVRLCAFTQMMKIIHSIKKRKPLIIIYLIRQMQRDVSLKYTNYV